MKPFRREIEAKLRSAASWWKWQLFLRRSLLIAIAVVLVLLLLGFGMAAGVLKSPGFVVGSLVVLLASGMVCWAITAVVTADSSRDRTALASAIEQVHSPLMDRLNTLVFLQETKGNALTPYADAIEKQTVDVLRTVPDDCPYPQHGVMLLSAALLALIMLNVLFYGYFRPWRNLATAEPKVTPISNRDQENVPDIPPLETPSEQAVTPDDQEPWGEVRISEPGRDLRTTQLDVVPLYIEAVTNRDMKSLAWYASRNGQEDIRHQLPEPEDPRYATHQTELVVDEFGLQVWDVLSYFAEATTRDDRTYRSDIYFLDVIPFAEELAKLPGGLEGPACNALNDLTAMVERHEEIIRQTRRLPLLDNRAVNDRAKRYAAFAQEQDDLALAAKYFKARLGQQFDQAPLDSVNRHLELAEMALKKSQESLTAQNAAEAENVQRTALAELASARKELYDKALGYPDKFKVPAHDYLAESLWSESSEAMSLEELEQMAQALDRENRLSRGQRDQARMAQQRQAMQQQASELQAARQFVQQSLLEQRNIERGLRNRQPKQIKQSAQRQNQLNQSFKDYTQEHPEPFRQASSECQKAGAAMGQASKAIESGQLNSQSLVDQSARSLQQLDDALEKQQQENGLADAYRLHQMLEDQVETLRELQQNPSEASSQECQASAGECNSLAGQFQRLAQQGGGKGGISEKLRQATGDGQPQQIQGHSQQLARAQVPADIREAATQLGQDMAGLSQALREALQQGVAGQQTGNSLTPTGQEAISRGLRRLESEARRAARGTNYSPGDSRRLRDGAMRDLAEGIPALYGHNERTQLLVDSMRRDLQEPEFRVNLATIQSLLRQIQGLRREVVSEESKPDRDNPLTDLNPTNLPPDYRRPIEKYFEELSKQQ